MTVREMLAMFDEGSEFNLEIYNMANDTILYSGEKDAYNGKYNHLDVECMHITEWKAMPWLTLNVIKAVD